MRGVFLCAALVLPSLLCAQDDYSKLYPVKEIGYSLYDRVSEERVSDSSIAAVFVSDPQLDLPTFLARERAEFFARDIPYAPEIAVGQGPSEDSLTYVRLLDKHGLPRLQFLAYGEGVKGGVNVACARGADGEVSILTAPISDGKTGALKIFDRMGIVKGEISPEAPAPYSIVSGDFSKQNSGAEFAVAPAVFKKGKNDVFIYSADGRLLDKIPVESPEAGDVQLFAAGDFILGAKLFNADFYWKISPAEPGHANIETVKLPPDAAGKYLARSAFGDLRAYGHEDELSTLEIFGEKEAPVKNVDVGYEENVFWTAGCTWVPEKPLKYYKNATYGHIRTDGCVFNFMDGISGDEGFADMHVPNIIGPLADEYIRRQREGEFFMWEPCFTHRGPGGMFEQGKFPHSNVDASTGLPKYSAVNRLNGGTEYKEFESGFSVLSYALGVRELDDIYLKPLYFFQKKLHDEFRKTPEKFFSLEPNHEHEISIVDSIGDYNPQMVRGFYEYLLNFHNSNPKALAKEFNAPIEKYFDAPRNLGRGGWDAYDNSNPFFVAWVFYNRYVVNRRLAQMFFTSLRAGFPPGIIKSHQIPDSFAIGSTEAFSPKIDRITPIDYAMSAGVNFGFTRYGVWFNGRDMAHAAASSGFDSVIMGEYGALSTDANATDAQAWWAFENGIGALHCMTWPLEWDKNSQVYNDLMAAAMRKIAESGRPRISETGGVSQVRAYDGPAGVFDIVALGANKRNTGLLKSVKGDGSWEGSVYTTPFRTTIDAARIEPQISGDKMVFDIPESMLGGEQAEIRFGASGKGRLKVEVVKGKRALAGMSKTYDIDGSKQCLFILRSQMPLGSLKIVVRHENLELDNVSAYKSSENIARLQRNALQGDRNKNGITFDIM